MVSSVTYGPAGEVRNINGPNSYSEARAYNSLFQLTSIITTQIANNQLKNVVDMHYTYPTDGSNIGKISQQLDQTTGEQVQYAYDSLGRLISAQTTASPQGSPWGYGYVYDGFGNLLSKNVTKGARRHPCR